MSPSREIQAIVPPSPASVSAVPVTLRVDLSASADDAVGHRSAGTAAASAAAATRARRRRSRQFAIDERRAGGIQLQLALAAGLRCQHFGA